MIHGKIFSRENPDVLPPPDEEPSSFGKHWLDTHEYPDEHVPHVPSQPSEPQAFPAQDGVHGGAEPTVAVADGKLTNG